jgi:hypothetical protein
MRSIILSQHLVAGKTTMAANNRDGLLISRELKILIREM